MNLKEWFEDLPKKGKIILLSSIATFVLIVVIVLVAALSGSNKIDLSQACVIKVDGLNTKGTASYQMDKQSLEKTIIGKTMNILKADTFIETVKCNLSKNENLKNDDEIIGKITYDETLAKQLNLAFKNTEIKVKVSGLPEGTVVDIFKNIKVTFTGTSPVANVSIINSSTDSFIKDIHFAPSKEIVGNGDIVTVTATYDKTKAIAQKLLVEQDCKDFTVSGLPEYLHNSKQLTDEITNQFEQIAEKSIKSNVDFTAAFFVNHIPNKTTNHSYTLGDKYSCQNIKLQKAYIVTEKENSNLLFLYFKQNKYCLISSVDILVNGDVVGTTYYKTEFTDVIIKDGKVSDAEPSNCTQFDTLEKAQQSIEDTYTGYNLEPVTIK